MRGTYRTTRNLEDVGPDGTRPSMSGRQKVAVQLPNFFTRDKAAKLWFALRASPVRIFGRDVVKPEGSVDDPEEQRGFAGLVVKHASLVRFQASILHAQHNVS